MQMKLRTSLNKNKTRIVFILSLFVLGIIVGVAIFIREPEIMKNIIVLEMDGFGDLIRSTNQNQILFNSLILLILFLLNFTVIGFLGTLFYLFYQGCSLGFGVAVFAHTFGIGGLLFALLFNIVTKLVFILILFYLVFLGIRVVKRIVGSIVLKKDEITYLFIKRHLMILGIVLGVGLLNEIIVYFLANRILKLFIFLL